MNKNNSREDQWLHHQVQEITPCFDGINMMTSSPSACSLGDSGGSAGRRSRTSKRAVPTTLLNANPSNFRALVQKFTGRSSGEANRRKGPVTLDFKSPTKVTEETIFPVTGDWSNPHVSDEQRHVTWSSSGAEATATYQLGEETNSVLGHDHDLLREYSGNSDLLREYSGNSSFDDGLDHIDDYYHDFHQETAILEEFMMNDLDL